MKFFVPLLLSAAIVCPLQASPVNINIKKKKNADKSAPVVETVETRADDAVPLPADTLVVIDSLLPRELTAKDTISDGDIVLPEGLDSDADSLIIEEEPYLQPPVSRGNNVDYPDSVYIRLLSALPAVVELPYNQVVKEYITLYTQKRRELVEKLLALNLYYEPIFEREIDKLGVPLELKYLPVIESALRPNAVSRVGATGLWQFMIGTAKLMGLEVNSVVDERRDPIRSTEQALRYLQQLYDTFGDWTLAIAAYNCGPGNVNKAIRRAGGKRDYWDIYPYLPKETRGYVPAFIAANYIMNYYSLHNIQSGEIELPAETDTVIVSKRLHFKQIADVLQVDVEELRRLNPQYRRDVVPATPQHRYSLVLPVEHALAFVGNEDSIANYQSQVYAQRITAELSAAARTPVEGYHRVKSGENLSVIAQKYRTSVANLRKWNNLKSNNIYPGMRLIVNSSAAQERKPAASTRSTSAPSAANTWVSNGVRYYKVKSGDSLWEISRKFPNLTVQKLKDANGLKSNELKPGQVLRIP